MKTKINLQAYFKQVITMALFLFLLTPFGVFAQTQEEQPLVCDPLPEDTEMLLECVDLWGTTPGSVNTGSTIYSGPGNGPYGTSMSYNSTDGRLLVVSSTAGGLAIVGQFYDPKTMEPSGGQFNIDQWDLFVGSPKTVYDPHSNRFLVIWIASHSNNLPFIYGRFVNADGSMPAAQFYIGGAGREPTLDLDSKNNKFVIEYEAVPQGYFLVTIDSAGAVSEPLRLNSHPGYEGQSAVTYNSNRDEYWYVYIWGVSGGDTAKEDTRVMLARVDASTMQKVGEPIQLSQVRLARNAFSAPGIAYSADDKAAVVSWTEMGRTPGMFSEVYGRTVYDDLSLSAEYPLLTSSTSQVSDFFGGSRNILYNQFTGTFALAGEDNNGGTTMVEFLANGIILDIKEALPPLGKNGNFVPGIGAVPGGFPVNTSADYATVKIRIASSPHLPPRTPAVSEPAPVIVNNVDTTSVARMITQIYVWSLGLAGMAAMVMVIAGGYLVMTARGNGQQVSQGREYIVGALIGLALLMGAYLILNTINPDLVNFSAVT